MLYKGNDVYYPGELNWGLKIDPEVKIVFISGFSEVSLLRSYWIILAKVNII